MDPEYRLSISTPDAMISLGVSLGRSVLPGAVIGLQGPLGAGKTTLARGIAEGMGIDEGYVVSSPTYTLMQSYPCARGDLHHLDLYRIKGPDDLDSTGYRDHLGENSVLIVEWPEREPSVLPVENLVVIIEYQGDGREVTLIPSGERYEKLVARLLDSLSPETPQSGDERDR